MEALRVRANTIHPNGGSRSNSASEWWGQPEIGFESLPIPEPQSGELLIQVKYCGLCGSDFHLASQKNGKLQYSGLAQLPVTIGHEFSGVVAAHGPNIPSPLQIKLPVGSLVTAEEMLWCGHCDACRANKVNHCENIEEIGFTVNGAQAQFLSVPAKNCWSLTPLEQSFDKDTALKYGSLVEPYSVAYRALFLGNCQAPWTPGLKVLVVGCGPIGLALLDLAKAAGSLYIDTLELEQDRRILSLAMGARKAYSSINEILPKEKYDLVVDAAGAVDNCLAILKRNATVGAALCLLARVETGGALDTEALITQNARIYGSQGHSGDATFGRVIELLAANRLQPDKMITEVIAPARALEKLKSQEKSQGKTLVRQGVFNV